MQTKKRATLLLRTIGFQMPIELLQSGLTGNITYSGQNVNLCGLHGKNFRMDLCKSGNLAAPTGERAPIHTPEANSGTVPKGSIRKDS